MSHLAIHPDFIHLSHLFLFLLPSNTNFRTQGPGLLGEAPLHQIPNPARFVNKDGKQQMLLFFVAVSK